MRTTARGIVLFFVDDSLYKGDSISNIHDRDLLCLWTALFVNSFVHLLHTLMKWGPLQNKHGSWLWFVSFYDLPDLVFTCTKTVSLSEIFVALGFSVYVLFLVLFFSQCLLEIPGLHAVLASCLTNLQKTGKGGYMAALQCRGLESSPLLFSLFSHQTTSRVHWSIFFAIFWFSSGPSRIFR